MRWPTWRASLATIWNRCLARTLPRQQHHGNDALMSQCQWFNEAHASRQQLGPRQCVFPVQEITNIFDVLMVADVNWDELL